MKKKTRARTYKPVTRRIKKARRKHRDLQKNMKDPVLRELWDNKKTVRQNMSHVTIDAFLNRIPEKYTPTFKGLSEQDKLTIQKLMQRYKDDYTAMARDIKLNRWQWTARQCENKAQILLKTERS